MVCMSSYPAARADAAAARLAHGRAAQHRLVRGLRRDAATRRPTASTPRRSATCSPTSRRRASWAPRSCGSRRDDPVAALLDFARSHGVGHIIIGPLAAAAGGGRCSAARCRCAWCDEAHGLRRPHRLARGRGGAAVTLRAKLLLAQAPLAVALVLVGVVSGETHRARWGASPELILKDNYRSVLAAAADEGGGRAHRQRRAVHGRRPRGRRGRAGRATQRDASSASSRSQESNITEPGEARGRRARCARAWDALPRARCDRFAAAPDRERTRGATSSALQPAFAARQGGGRRASSTINQDAMVRKSDQARRAARAQRRRGRDRRRWSALRCSACCRLAGAHRRGCCGRCRRPRARRCGGSARATWRRARRVRGQGRDRARWRSEFNTMADRLGAVPQELARRAAAGAAGGRRRPSTACPIRCWCSTPTASCSSVEPAPPRRCSASASRAAREPLARRSTRRCARWSSACARTSLGGQRRLRAQGASRRRSRVDAARRRALPAAARRRRSTPRTAAIVGRRRSCSRT